MLAFMASPVIYDAIKGYLQTQFAPMPVLDWDQVEPAIEQGTNPFLLLEEVFEMEDAVGIGDPSGICQREEADLLIQCLYPAPESSAAARRQAEQVRAALRYRTINGVRVVNVSPPEAGPMNDGLWTRYACAVSVEYDSHVPIP